MILAATRGDADAIIELAQRERPNHNRSTSVPFTANAFSLPITPKRAHWERYPSCNTDHVSCAGIGSLQVLEWLLQSNVHERYPDLVKFERTWFETLRVCRYDATDLTAMEYVLPILEMILPPLLDTALPRDHTFLIESLFLFMCECPSMVILEAVLRQPGFNPTYANNVLLRWARALGH
ncbi:hypothetical protein GGF32_003921 [Allomyces javanicus]|nr:hypothetical protein GGF32_003921 [Allomyces javanicus]